MTSNLGAHVLQESLAGRLDGGESLRIPEGVKGEVMEILRHEFRPEFLNRVDEIVIFHPLARTQIRRIVDIQLGRIDRLLADKNLALEVTDGAKDLLADEGYDPAFGARPLKRALQKNVLDPLAIRLLQGEFRPGDRIVAEARGGELVFRREGEPLPTQPEARA
jgi:ATP-dependent Clp protease ATP-binding subunit ClpB